MKSSIYAVLSASLLSSFAAAAAVPQTNGTGLTSQVPPPPCLYACIQKYGNCAVCTPDGDAKIEACYSATCGNPPTGANPYAGVYYHSICSGGGYLDYSTSPSKFVVIPPESCAS
ncbi:MAG: hypothetical protein Q9221_006799 [Calogaya cf. arnoldii]